ncbi:MAG: hypothetical protein KC478_04980 [Bacteriovoracaceae bacterium]|nr:hypothetical protein [Bacteriovoracaceae bacterium]
MESQRQILNHSGQTLVEYILLLAVVVSLTTFAFKSDYWQSYFGPDGKIDEVFRARLEYSYRHALGGKDFYSQPNYGDRNHDSYYDNGSTRFFRPREAYPAQ